jgi:prohibitin 1
MRLRNLPLLVAALLLGAGCAIVGPGERGVKRTLGELGRVVHEPGPVFFNPFVTSLVTVPVRTRNVEVRLSLPSREGLTIEAEISILYRVLPAAVPAILETIGEDYERSVVLTTFRSAAADVSSRHNAKDMHSSERAGIERQITDTMNGLLGGRGFEVERVLLKSIALPSTLSRAIEEKLAAEQEAERMTFVLQREQQEAARRRTEAEGIRDAQQVINQGLTELLIKWRAIEVFRELSQSPNAKVIFTDGKSPLLLPAQDP